MSAAELRALYERKLRTLKRHPALGQTSVRTNVRLVSGLACEARQADWTTRSDLPTDEGGAASAPPPGALMRAALGACLAMGIRTWAARLDVSIEAVEIDVVADFDERGQLGAVAEIEVGWQRLAIEIRIESAAPPGEVRRVVEHADRLSPMLANLSPAIARVHALTITQPKRIQPVTLTVQE